MVFHLVVWNTVSIDNKRVLDGDYRKETLKAMRINYSNFGKYLLEKQKPQNTSGYCEKRTDTRGYAVLDPLTLLRTVVLHAPKTR